MYSFLLPLLPFLLNFSNTPVFESETIDSNVSIGYGVVTGDVDGDGKPDLILADKKQFVWYRNGDWKRFVLAENLSERDNVCIAARDIDGDGKVEIAVGAQWNPAETLDEAQSGSVHFLVRPEDPTQIWKPIKLPHEPTVHRMYWVKTDDSKYQLVVLPLHGRGNQSGEGAGVKVYGYEKPDDPTTSWKMHLIDDSMHLTHNMTIQTFSSNQGESVFIAGKEGVKSFSFQKNQWAPHFPNESIISSHSFGELSMSFVSKSQVLIAGVEPIHGNQVTVHLADSKDLSSSIKARVILDEGLKEGHGIVTGDFIGNGKIQIVAGWRIPDENGKVGIKLYHSLDDTYLNFETYWIDMDGMATESLTAADLNGDGKLDLIAAGRASGNLKIYWNRN